MFFDMILIKCHVIIEMFKVDFSSLNYVHEKYIFITDQETNTYSLSELIFVLKVFVLENCNNMLVTYL